jgi:putrescine importer
VSRLLYVMGRDNVIPASVFARLHSRYKTPVLNIALSAWFRYRRSSSTWSPPLDHQLRRAGRVQLRQPVGDQPLLPARRQPQGLANQMKYLVLPTIGFCIIVSLWLDLNEHSLMFGGIWAALGVIYLGWLTKAFRVAPPNYIAE